MKAELFNKQFILDGSDSERYGDIVKKVSDLVDKPYMAMHSLFTREKWSVEEIERSYQNATKHNGSVTPEIAWWANRKRRNSK